jgi:geranylgeranyl diphosphate synthase type II
MDNDAERRGMPTLHKVSGEATALLASYALIAAGYACLANCSRELEDSSLPFSLKSNYIGLLALENVTYNTGLFGATGGQYIDIYPPNLTLEVIIDVINKKTVSLFEISFVLGWLYGGGNPENLNHVKAAAAHFGLAFQIADDLGDQEQDKINGRSINVANLLGKDKAVAMFHEKIKGYRNQLQCIGIATPELLSLAQFLELQL